LTVYVRSHISGENVRNGEKEKSEIIIGVSKWKIGALTPKLAKKGHGRLVEVENEKANNTTTTTT
jgi:hypothetical protein